MTKRLLLFLATIVLISSLTGCGDSRTIVVNTDNDQNLSGSVFGKDALIKIGNGLWYDSTTRIVYWWNGALSHVYHDTTPTPYYAPNGLPYRYNPETNTFEEIKRDGL